MAKTWVETEISGEVTSFDRLDPADCRDYRGDYYEDPNQDGQDDLIFDNECDIVKVETTEGTFLIISQNYQGHGCLYIVKEAE